MSTYRITVSFESEIEAKDLADAQKQGKAIADDMGQTLGKDWESIDADRIGNWVDTHPYHYHG